MKPIILYEETYTQEKIDDFKKKNRIWEIKDLYVEQRTELFEILYPAAKFSPDYQKKLTRFLISKKNNGDWVYFPWNGYLIHMVNRQDYQKIQTNRNQRIITEKEQRVLSGACLGFVGLSIGSHFAIGASYSGIGSSFKIADFDKISTSNLNRIRSGIQNIGLPKTEYTAQAIYEINPYSNVDVFDRGLQDKQLEAFFKTGRKLSVVFEAIDDFQMKIKLRLFAKKAQVPVIMLTNLGDNILIDIERYDIDKNLSLFNGLLGDTPEKILQAKITEKEKVEFAIKIVGKEHLPTRVLETLFEINKTLVGRPQICSTVTVAGGIASYLIRKIILKHFLPSGRTFVSFDTLFNLRNREKSNKKLLEILEKRFLH